MGFLLSPKVNVSEIDLTNVIPAVATTDVGYVGLFRWGPLSQRVLLSSEKVLAELFGKPDTDTAEHFFSAANVLSYTNKLRLVRIAHQTQTAATLVNKLTTTASSTTVTVAHTSHGQLTGDIARVAGVAATFDGIPASQLNGKHVITVVNANSYTFTVTTAASAGVSNGGGTITVGFEDAAFNATSDKYTGSNLTGEGVLIRNEDHYKASYETGGGDVGLWAAKYPGKMGNSLKVSLCPSANAYSQALTVSSSGTALTGSGQSFTTKLTVGSIIRDASGNERAIASVTDNNNAVLASAFPTNLSTASVTALWQYYSEFGVAPGTSAYAVQKNSLNDECHVIVVDEDGLFSGIRGQVLEKFAFVSLMSGAKTNQGDVNYYKSVINQKSKYIWWMDHLPAGTNWGTSDPSTTFTAVNKPDTVSLDGGQDGNTTATVGEFEAGYDYFKYAEEVDVSVVVGGPANATLAEYIVQNICERRKDCVAVLSPSKASVVDNPGDEVADITTFLSSVSASSYAIVDSGWGYQYDRYNDVYRWLPLNSHIAGLIARVDTERDPWWSPAGLIYGHLKNVIKLAWNPTEAQRDDLYLKGVNSVINIAGQGVVLFGDKTYLNRPSAFDRINVRRLFIVLEKAIATASKFILFQFNDEITRAQFRNLVEPFLREVKGRRGVIDFRVVCDESNNTPEVIDQNQFVGDIYIKPARSINFIQLNFVAVRTGVTFEEVIGAF